MSSERNWNGEYEDSAKEEPQKFIFADSSPYPDVRVQEKNHLYGRIMLDNMGGSNSEMSAISLYIYNNLLLENHVELSKIFRKISIVEMHHLETFGKIARLLGENPRLWTQRGNRMVYWSPAYNQYPMEMESLLKNALIGEEKAVQKYEEQCNVIKDANIVACLKRIIKDEELHIEIFKELCRNYC
ncbi:MAG TPA: manganese catalase family protein [Candidatus Scybalomonas excrementigallinarum]|nr:manganese catalase family protein [Candidatus Scybalomonas excrementigallinarum]